jgi:hypothetical protein
MTPIAQAFMRRFTLPLRKREPVEDSSNLLGRKLFEDFHCFELSAVDELICELTASFDPEDTDIGASDRQVRGLGKMIFLPAPRTWLENGKDRADYLVQQNEEWADLYNIGRSIERAEAAGRRGADWHIFHYGRVNLKTGYIFSWNDGDQITCSSPLLSSLAVINSPRIISRTVHEPHRGLQRDLNHLHGGKFPLRAWTEIVLKVRDPGIEGVPRLISGPRALHFVRKHIRIRLGQLEYVSSHWRGDPSVGIKQSRYRVVS